VSKLSPEARAKLTGHKGEDGAGDVPSESVLKRVASIGTISVEFWEVRNVRQNTSPLESANKSQRLKDLESLSETVLKGDERS
jgi:hypothetical protein